MVCKKFWCPFLCQHNLSLFFKLLPSGCHVCLEGMPSLVPGVLSLLVVAIRDVMSAISRQEEHVKVLVSLIIFLPLCCYRFNPGIEN
jgi:hypothetical protein